MGGDRHERFVRWQGYTIAQLSFSINLFMGFAVASLAYAINIKLHSQYAYIDEVIIIWATSAASGCLATIVRLLDFRYTSRKIKNPNRLNKFMSKYCGPITWGLHWVQIISYAMGAYRFVGGALVA